jgi:preprotein translocase subunit SecG
MADFDPEADAEEVLRRGSSLPLDMMRDPKLKAHFMQKIVESLKEEHLAREKEAHQRKSESRTSATEKGNKKTEKAVPAVLYGLPRALTETVWALVVVFLLCTMELSLLARSASDATPPQVFPIGLVVGIAALGLLCWARWVSLARRLQRYDPWAACASNAFRVVLVFHLAVALHSTVRCALNTGGGMVPLFGGLALFCVRRASLIVATILPPVRAAPVPRPRTQQCHTACAAGAHSHTQ